MTILYQSTRGVAPELDLRGVTLAGLASDGGLYVPKTWPEFSLDDIAAMNGKPYADVAFQVLKPFVAGVLPDEALKDLIQKAYSSFSTNAVQSPPPLGARREVEAWAGLGGGLSKVDPPSAKTKGLPKGQTQVFASSPQGGKTPCGDITPLIQLSDKLWILELFHGPTLAFKDVALQLLGHVFEYFLAQNNERMTVIGATSGDTGSAAMAALAHRKNIDVFILYPAKGPSDIQRKQMTCMDAPNVHALAIEGNFDDCQSIVKSLFNDAVLRAKYKFAAVNSINWLRILVQTVYYFVAAGRFAPRPVSFVVPTGNFGNIYAAYVASKCGLPVSKLAVASNRNDILSRFFTSGRMKTETMQSTLSPSMDIQVSSNFERLLFDLCRGDAAQLRGYMDQLKAKGEFEVTPMQLGMARQLFTASRADDDLTLKTIADVYKESGYVLDPHSAVGVAAAKQLARELPEPVICLATAHPAKFPDAINRAIGITPKLPDMLANQLKKNERITILPANAKAVEKFISEKATV